MISSSEESITHKKISYEQKTFIKTSLRQLGINSKNNGFIVIQKVIKYAYEKDMISINLEDIYRYIAKLTSKSNKTIESIIRYALYNVNSKQFSSNYEKIFGIDFSFEFFSLKNFISDFLDILETIK
jgi:sporulation initiation factor Spo0A C-terminal domain protein